MPPLTGPDEWARANRATAVVRGELTGAPSPPPYGNALVWVHVPESIRAAGEDSRCFLGEPGDGWVRTVDYDLATCPRSSGGSGLVTATTSEHRGQPFYYALVGLPTLAFPDVTGLYLMRLAGAALCCALLASAFASLLRLRSNRLVVLGGAVALTPAVLYFAATTNSAGPEMAATLALYASGAALARAESVDGRLVRRTGVALVVLVLSRGLSPAYAALALVVLALVARPGRVRELAARRDVRAWGALAAVSVAASAVWLAWAHPRVRPGAPVGTRPGPALGQLPWDLRTWSRCSAAPTSCRPTPCTWRGPPPSWRWEWPGGGSAGAARWPSLGCWCSGRSRC